MCVELPILKTCCCLPLRTGLLLIGIAKMIIVAIAVLLEKIDYCGGSLTPCYEEHISPKMRVELGLYSCMAVIDFIFIIIMVTGVYLRHAKLLIISCYYTIVTTAIWILLNGAKKIYDMYIILVLLKLGVTSLRYAIVFDIMELILILMFQFYTFLLIKGFIYEVTGKRNDKCSTRSTTDYECLVGTDSADERENVVTYSALPKDLYE